MDIEQSGRRVTHLLHHLLQCQLLIVVKLQHHRQRPLHKRQSGWGLEVVAQFFIQGVRSMISTDHIDTVFNQRLDDGFAVCGFLDRRVALDEAILQLVKTLVKIEMMNASLGGNTFLIQRLGIKQRKLFGRGDM